MIKNLMGSLVVGVLLGGVVYGIVLATDSTEKVTDFVTEIRFGFNDFALGQYYFNHGDAADGTYDIKKARYYFERAAAKDPNQHILLWHQQGRIDFLEGNFNDAIKDFNRQIELYGDALPNVHYMMALTYGYQARTYGITASWDKAEDHFRTYLEYDPLSPWARVDLAWIHFAQGEYEDMIELLEVGATYEPDNAWILNMLGLAYLNTGDGEKARQYFRWAETEANKLTTEEWGKSYPGNDPAIWGLGLEEFRTIIADNIVLTEN